MKNNFFLLLNLSNQASTIDCSDSNSINYDINQCGDINGNKLDEPDPYSDIELVFYIIIFSFLFYKFQEL